MKLPRAKTSGLVVQELRQEALVYNLETNKAYSLNETSRLVFEACDGKQTFNELKRKYKFTDDLIHLTLGELNKNNLLEDYAGNHFGGLTRREAVKRVGLATMIALPVIAELVAPQASEAASGALRTNGTVCTQGSQCQSNMCARGLCCSSNTFESCRFSQDCCSGVACTGNVCCQGTGRTCDTRSPNECCDGLKCVAAPGETNGSCQPPA